MMMMQFNEHVSDLCHTSLKSSLDLMNVWLGGIKRLQSYQTGAIEEVRSSHNEIADQLGSVRTIEQLQAAHAELAHSQITRLWTYWNGLYAASCQSQVELLKEAQAKAREVADEIDEKLEAATPGSVPVLSALKVVMGATHSTYAATARTTEEIARISAAQLDAASANAIRQGNGKATKRAAA
jgi:hypothetical protein